MSPADFADLRRFFIPCIITYGKQCIIHVGNKYHIYKTKKPQKSFDD